MAAGEAEEERLQRKIKHRNTDHEDFEYVKSDSNVVENGMADEPRKPFPSNSFYFLIAQSQSFETWHCSGSVMGHVLQIFVGLLFFIASTATPYVSV